MKKINDIDLAYIGGFFDGEGTCGINCNKDVNSHTIHVSFTNNNLEILTEISNIIGLGKITSKQSKGLLCYNLNIRRNELREFLPIFRSSVLCKRKQIDLLIKYFEYSFKSGVKSSINPLSQQEIDNRYNIYEELKSLNQTGIDREYKELTIFQTKELNLSYIAGIIDGEGQILLERDKTLKGYKVDFAITNTDLSLISYVGNILEAGKISILKTSKDNHRTRYRISFTIGEIRKIFPVLVNYLRLKKKQAQLVLEYEKYNGKLYNLYYDATKLMIIYEEMKELNRKRIPKANLFFGVDFNSL